MNTGIKLLETDPENRENFMILYNICEHEEKLNWLITHLEKMGSKYPGKGIFSEYIEVLREKNPQIRNWNRLGRDVQLVLPEAPPPTNGGVDFYTIQVGAFREEEGASRRASELAKKGVQNLFLVKGGAGKEFTFVCAGVFESGKQSLGSVQTMQAWGYEDAFPLRIRAERLEDILFAFKSDPTSPAKVR